MQAKEVELAVAKAELAAIKDRLTYIGQHYEGWGYLGRYPHLRTQENIIRNRIRTLEEREYS